MYLDRFYVHLFISASTSGLPASHGRAELAGSQGLEQCLALGRCPQTSAEQMNGTVAAYRCLATPVLGIPSYTLRSTN